MRDLVIHHDDLVVGTHGRSIWILDNISPLRELREAAASAVPYLFSPPQATRVRWNMFSDTPLPPEEPTGHNPPDGAIIDYFLPENAGRVTLDILFGDNRLIRRFSSDDVPVTIDSTSLPHPTYWIRPPQELQTSSGHHRFVWDLRYAPPKDTRRQFSIAAVHKNTPDGPLGPFVHPSTYTVRLTVDGVVSEKEIEVRLDPRVDAPATDIELQTEFSLRAYDAYHRLLDLRNSVDEQLRRTDLSVSMRESLDNLRGSGRVGDPDILYGNIVAASPEDESIVGLQYKFLFMLNVLQGADAKPTTQARRAVEQLEQMESLLVDRREALR